MLASALAAAQLASASAQTGHGTIHDKIEAFKARHAFNRLSADGQRALADVFKARDILASGGTTDAALPALYDAQKRLAAADKAGHKFEAAEADLHRVPAHPPAAGHVPAAGPNDWVPVGGEFIATETLAPEQKSAVDSANSQLKSGDSGAAARTAQVIGENVDFIVALAPVGPFGGAINRATVFTEGRQPKEALEALDQALDTLVFVSDDYAETAVPPAGAPTGTSAGTPSGNAQ